jgi:hypothetical protein
MLIVDRPLTPRTDPRVQVPDTRSFQVFAAGTKGAKEA